MNRRINLGLLVVIIAALIMSMAASPTAYAAVVVDPTFNPGTGANGDVWALAVQPDGNVLLGGNFTIVNSAAREGIARLNANGSLDSSFDPGTGANSTVLALTVQPDGNVLIGGAFTSINGTARNRIARIEVALPLDSASDG